MEIYIVIGKLERFNNNFDNLTHWSSTNKEIALNNAVELANGTVTVGGTNKRYILESIIKVNIDSIKVTKYELVLQNGRFLLSELKNS